MPCTKDLSIDQNQPVLVTGATGYIAGVLIQELLEAGVKTINVTVRDAAKRDRYKHLQLLADKHHESEVIFFSADLLREGSFADAMKGCSVVFHTASPFLLPNSKIDPQKDLVDPALIGTRNVLESVNETDTVKRVVLTGSIAGIYSDAADLNDKAKRLNKKQDDPTVQMTEDDWNQVSTLRHQPYFYSKKLAEEKAWEMMKAQSRWSLVVINPTLVLGPGLKCHDTASSYYLMKQVGGGPWTNGVPNLSNGVVDVRDVAAAHIAAAYLPDAEGRHIVSACTRSFPQIGEILGSMFPSSPQEAAKDEDGVYYPIGTKRLPVPKFMVWMLAPYLEGGGVLTRAFVARNMNIDIRFDNTKSKQALGIEYRPIEETLREMYQQMVDAKYVEVRTVPKKRRGRNSS